MSFEVAHSRKHIHCVFGAIGRREHIDNYITSLMTLILPTLPSPSEHSLQHQIQLQTQQLKLGMQQLIQ